MIYLWNFLKSFEFLSTREFNQDPIGNLFCLVHLHGIANSNPNCHQFIAALKTIVVISFNTPLARNSNCKNNKCEALRYLSVILDYHYNNNKRPSSVEVEHPGFSSSIEATVDNDHSYSQCYEKLLNIP